MKTIVLATNNQNKLREIKRIFINHDVEIKSLKEVGYFEEIIEDGLTFEDNAIIKARQVAKALNLITISDDSGLEVEALNNEPGVYSARYAGEQHNDDDNNALLLKNLVNVENRKARYVCCICVYNPNDEYRTVIGTCDGLIIDDARGKNGFGYDPYFFVPEFNQTFAEVSLDKKNTISHRARALRLMEELINEDFSFKR